MVDENNQLIVRESAHLPQEEMKRFSGLRIVRIAVDQVTGIFHEVRDIDSEHFGEPSNPLWLRDGSCSFPFGDGLLLHSEFPGEIGLFEVEFFAAELQEIAEHRHRQTCYSEGYAVDSPTSIGVFGPICRSARVLCDAAGTLTRFAVPYPS